MTTRRGTSREWTTTPGSLSHYVRRALYRVRSAHASGQQGQGLMEFALALPIVLMVILGIIEFAFVFTNLTSLSNAASEGARHGAVQPRDGAGVLFTAQEQLVLPTPDSVTMTIAYDSGPETAQFTDTAQIQIGESRIVVTVTHDLHTITPVFHALWPIFHVERGAARTIVSLGDTETIMPTGDPFGGDEGSPAITLDVSADPVVTYAGESVLFTYTVSNVGDVDLTEVTISDGFGNTFVVGSLAAGATAVESTKEVLNANKTNSVTVTGVDEVSQES
ncbi:MAG: hypothetical protein E3J64_09845, partial [Anaerolineales bacterium]